MQRPHFENHWLRQKKETTSMAAKKSGEMRTKKKSLIGFSNCLLITFEMDFFFGMKMAKSF